MAGTIDNLNFEIILKDDEFGKRVQENMKLAKELNISLTALLDLQSKVKNMGVKTPNATQQIVNQEKVAAAQKRTAAAEEALAAAKLRTKAAEEALVAANARRVASEQKAAAATARSIKAQTSLQKSIKSTASAVNNQASVLGELRGLALQYLSIRGVASFVSSLVRITGEFELQKTTLAAIVGELHTAESVLAQIKDLSLESPFTFKELATYAKQLSAYAVPAEELYQTTRMLADVSAGLGVDMSRLVLAFGQVKSAAFLRGQEVRQFTEAGIPVLAELAKQFEAMEGQAVSAGEVFDRISARMVPFEMILKMFKDLTSEGGKFYKMQETQAETLKGKIMILKGAFEVMLNEIGQNNDGFINRQVDRLRGLVDNWRAVSAILSTVLVSYGAYKTALVAVAGVEKIILAAQTFKKWQRFNSILKASGVNVNKFASFMRIFGISVGGAVSAATAAVGALATGIVVAVKRANELKRELEEIVSAEALKSDQSVDGLNRLVESLKNANKGSQEYRDIISELNRKYDEYLPRVLTEADAYEQVREAADAAAEAIRGRARAIAFERGQAAIEDNFGKDLRTASSSLRSAVVAISGKDEDTAVEFLKNFNDALAKAAKDKSSWTVFEETFAKYFGDSVLSSIKEGDVDKLGISMANEIWDNYVDRVSRYAKIRKDIDKAENKLVRDIESSIIGTEYSTAKERDLISPINEAYRTQLLTLNELVLTQDEYNKKLKELKIQRLTDLINAYKTLPGRSDMVEKFQKQLDAIQKTAKGWRKTVQDTIEGMGLGENSSFGLWPKDTTSSNQYVEDMAKRYKEIADQIKNIESFDKDQVKRLQNEKEAIETVAKALGIDINARSKAFRKEETEEEKRLKRLINSLRDLNEQYLKFKELGKSDEGIKSFFKENYPDLVKEMGEEFVTSFNYMERAANLIKELAKLDKESANRLAKDLGVDNYSQEVKRLEKVQKGYKKSAKAAGDFFDAVRKWSSEDTSIEGSGITFDVSKIASDLQEKINEIQLRAIKAKELFGKIDIKDDESVANVKKLFSEEFGEDAWDVFWKAYKEKGLQVIDELSSVQIAYETKTAQEKLNDLAQKYVKEQTFGLNLSDWGDKSIQQIKAIQQRLTSLLSDVKFPKETEEAIKALGLSTEDLIKKIKSLLGGHIENASIEKFKALSKVIKTVTNQTDQLGHAMEELGDTMNSSALKGFGKAIKYLGEFTDMILESNLITPTFKKQVQDVSETAEDVSDAASNAVENISNSSDLVTMVIKVGLSLMTSLIEGINDSEKAFRDATLRAVEYAIAINNIDFDNLLKGSESLFGTDSYKQAADAAKEAEKYLANINWLKDQIGTTSQDIIDIGNTSFWANFNSAFVDKYNRINQQLAGDIVVDMRSAWQKYWGTSGSDLIQIFNINDFLDKNGMIDGNKVRDFVNQYGDYMSDANKAVLLTMVGQWDLYVKALETTTAYLSDMMGQVADNMADSFVDSFKESGEAALDYAQIMDDVATNIAKSVVKSMIIEQVADPELIKEIGNLLLSGDEAGALSLIDKAMQSAKILAPKIQAFLETMEPYFQMGEDTDGKNTLAEGVKGITEDTANLLASYLNAIRADVSYAKTLWERMDQSTQAIASALAGFSAPSLMEYQAQIAANTYNTSMHTQEIMLSLRSVITGDGGLSAIRILQY